MSEKDTRKRLQVGGQAVIEGVMMRSPELHRDRGADFGGRDRRAEGALQEPRQAVPTSQHSGDPGRDRVRRDLRHRDQGAFVLGREGDGGSSREGRRRRGLRRPRPARRRKKPRAGLSVVHIALTIVAAFALGFGLFFYLPLFLTELTGLTQGVLFNLVDGVIRLVFLVMYIVLITRWKEMRRIFEYHGAEHKTISAFEEEGRATPENVRAYSTLHSRCSTSFLLLVVVVSILVFMILGRPQSVGDKIVRFAFIPVIGGVSYELLKLSANPVVRRYMAPLVWPGLFLQRLTTKEPSSDQIEVAIAALDACLGDKIVES